MREARGHWPLRPPGGHDADGTRMPSRRSRLQPSWPSAPRSLLGISDGPQPSRCGTRRRARGGAVVTHKGGRHAPLHVYVRTYIADMCLRGHCTLSGRWYGSPSSQQPLESTTSLTSILAPARELQLAVQCTTPQQQQSAAGGSRPQGEETQGLPANATLLCNGTTLAGVTAASRAPASTAPASVAPACTGPDCAPPACACFQLGTTRHCPRCVFSARDAGCDRPVPRQPGSGLCALGRGEGGPARSRGSAAWLPRPAARFGSAGLHPGGPQGHGDQGSQSPTRHRLPPGALWLWTGVQAPAPEGGSSREGKGYTGIHILGICASASRATQEIKGGKVSFVDKPDGVRRGSAVSAGSWPGAWGRVAAGPWCLPRRPQGGCNATLVGAGLC
jgi:hypothetical protein